MSELSDDQVAELLAWAKHMRGIYEQQTPWQQDLLWRLIESVDNLPSEQREPIVRLIGGILRTIMTFHEGFKQTPQFIQRGRDDEQ